MQEMSFVRYINGGSRVGSRGAKEPPFSSQNEFSSRRRHSVVYLIDAADITIIMYVERRDDRFSDVGALRCVGSSLLGATAVSKRNGE